MTTESPRQREAFEHWVVMPKRSLQRTAGKYKLSNRTVTNWFHKFDWEKRAAAIDQAISTKSESNLVDDAVKRRKRQLDLTGQIIEKALATLRRRKKVITYKDLVGVMRHELLLIGDDTERASVSVKLEDWLKGKKA